MTRDEAYNDLILILRMAHGDRLSRTMPLVELLGLGSQNVVIGSDDGFWTDVMTTVTLTTTMVEVTDCHGQVYRIDGDLDPDRQVEMIAEDSDNPSVQDALAAYRATL